MPPQMSDVQKAVESKAMNELIAEGISERQKALVAKHGTPAGFAQACYELVPGTISMDEAKAAIEKYQAEWDAAGDEASAAIRGEQ